MRSSIDLSQLPFPGVLETLDFETIFAERKAQMIAAYPDAADVLELESEPLTKLLQENAYRELLLRQRVNDAARSVLLAYSGGSDLDHLGALLDVARFPGETDDAYRLRIQQSPYRFSVAGPAQAYREHAVSAHASIKDVAVSSPEPGKVLVTVLDKTGSAPLSVLSAVDSAVSAQTVRPITDMVIVESAIIVPYEVHAIIDTHPGPEGEVVRRAAVDAVWLHSEQNYIIEGEITRSGLYSALRRPGVSNVELLSPKLPAGTEDVIIHAQARTAPKCTAVIVTIRSAHG